MPYTKKMIYFENMAWMTALSKDNTCIILKLFLLETTKPKICNQDYRRIFNLSSFPEGLGKFV